MEGTNPKPTPMEMVEKLKAELKIWEEKAKIKQYEDWEVDKKVYVRDSNMVPWIGAHFCKINMFGALSVWSKGKTSHTTDNFQSWKFITDVIPEGDDLSMF